MFRKAMIKIGKIKFPFLLALFISLVFPIVSLAAVSCDNNNWQYSERCIVSPASFTVKENGEVFGETKNGILFSQTNVINGYTHMQKFEMESVYWYISDRGIIYAENDSRALSIYLAKIS